MTQLKWVTFVAALGLGVFEHFDLNKKWQYLNRFYPEATEFQKNLAREAELHKFRGMRPELSGKDLSLQEKMIYSQMYRLAPYTPITSDRSFMPEDWKSIEE